MSICCINGQSRASPGQAVFEQEASDLDGRLAADRRTDEQGADEIALAAPARLGLADRLAARCTIEADADGVVARTLVPEDVLAGLQLHVAYSEGCLRDEEVRVLSLGGVAGGDHHHTRDEAAPTVGCTRRRAKLRLDILLDDGRARRNHAPQLLLRGGTPARGAGSRPDCAHAEEERRGKDCSYDCRVHRVV